MEYDIKCDVCKTVLGKVVLPEDATEKQIKQATPMWFDESHLFVIREAYNLAKSREKITGFPWDVDHVIPLRGKNSVSKNHLETTTSRPSRTKCTQFCFSMPTCV
jgi:hypothetical protein